MADGTPVRRKRKAPPLIVAAGKSAAPGRFGPPPPRDRKKGPKLAGPEESQTKEDIMLSIRFTFTRAAEDGTPSGGGISFSLTWLCGSSC